MALRRFALIILIGFFPCSNAAVAVDDVEAADVSKRKTVGDVSVSAAPPGESVAEPLDMAGAGAQAWAFSADIEGRIAYSISGGGDDHGDTRSTATHVALRSTTTGSIEHGTDADWFRFEVPARGLVVIELSGSIWVIGTLFDASRNPVDGGGPTYNIFIKRNLDAGTYYVRVRPDGTRSGKYTLHLRTDVIGNTRSAADLLGSFWGHTPATIYPSNDLDWFRFEVSTWGDVVIESSGDLDTVGTLFDASGNHVEQDDDDGDRLNFRIERTLYAGVYYVRVHSFLGRAAGGYTLHLRTAGAYDRHGGSTRVALPSTTTGTVFPPWDVDGFRFEVSTRDTVVIELEPGVLWGSSYTTVGDRLQREHGFDFGVSFAHEDPDENNIGRVGVGKFDDLIGGNRFERTLDPGTYYVSVYSEFSDESGNYTLHLRGDADDPSNRQPKQAPNVDRIDGVDLGIPAQCGLEVEICVRDYQCEDGDEVRVSVNDAIAFEGEIFNRWQCEIVPVNEGSNSVSFLALNGTGFKEACNDGDVNTGELRITARGGDAETQRRRHSGGAGSEANLEITVGPRSNASCSLGTDDDTDGGGGDDHGNSLATATRVTLPSITTGTIDPGNDTDWFRFEVSASGAVVMESSGDLDILGTLVDARGRSIVQNDDGDGSGYPNFRMVWTLDPGTYYVRVDSDGAAPGTYALHLRTGDRDVAAVDVHGNTRATATRISLPSTTAGVIDSDEDEDYFRFEVAASSTVVMESVGATCNTLVTLFDAAGNLIEITLGYKFHMERTLDPGTYYVRVQGVSFFCPVGSTSGYTLHLRTGSGEDGGGGDDHGNIRQDATRVSLPSTTAGTIDRGVHGDEDYFRFEVAASSTVVMESGGSLDVVGTLFNDGGRIIVQNDDGSGFPNFRIERTLDPGTYFFRVHSYQRSTYGNYALHLRTGADGDDGGGAAGDDHGNSLATATRGTLPSTTAGTIDPGEDEDYFLFEVAASSTVMMESVGGLDVAGTLFDAGGNRIALDDDGGFQSNFRMERTLDPGAYYVRVHSHGAQPGAYALHLRAEADGGDGGGAAGDAHGNSLATATRVALPSITTGTIDPGNDTDWFRFEVSAVGAVVMESGGGTGTGDNRNVVDVVGTLFDAGGNLIALDDDGGAGHNFRIERTLDPGTYYYVRVHSNNGAALGAYALHLRTGADGGDGGGAARDAHGNSRATATRISLPSTTAGAIDPGEDEDYFRFEVAASSAVVMESVGGLDVVGTLFDAGGNRIARNSYGAGYLNFRMERTLDPGAYYVRVHSNGAAPGAYALHLRTGADGGDGGGTTDDDHGNSRATATRISLPSTTAGTIDPGEDEDYFRFEVAASSAVVMESGGGLDVVGTLFDAEGNRIALDDDGGVWFNFRMERTLDPGTYYVRVHSSSAWTGAYALHLRAAGDAHGNSLANATRVTLPSITMGAIDPGEDEDYFRFEVAASSTVVMESVGGPYVVGTLFDAGGNRIAPDDDEGYGFNFRMERILDPGTYYVRVHSYRAAPGAYALHLRVRAAGDDHGNSLANATWVTLPSITAGTIDPVEDEDYFRFEVAASSIVVMGSGGDGSDVVGTLFDARGKRIALDDNGGAGSNFRIERTLDAGAYYVRVHSWDGGAYALYLRTGVDGGDGGDWGGTTGDDHGNTRATATRISLPSTTAGTIDPGEDEDYFRFEVAASSAVVMESVGDLDVVGTLFDAEGNRIARNAHGAGYPNFRMERTLDPGTYYVRVHSNGAAPGAYALHLRTGADGGDGGGAAGDDHGNTRATATRISLPSTTAGAIDPGEDEDYFRFEVAASSTVVMGGDGLRISTPTGSSVEPFQQVSLAVEGGTEGADYDILVDLSGTGAFEAEDTIEVAPVRAAENQLLMAAPLPEALAKNNAARLFAVRVRERGSETMSTPLTLNLGETNVPPSLAGHPTVILDVVLKAAYESLDDPLLTVEAGAIEPGRSVRTARALGLSTAYSDAQAEALLRSLFGISLVESDAADVGGHQRTMASAGRGAAVRCEALAPDALCDAYRRLTNCVGDAIDGFGSGSVSGDSLDQCARSGATAVVEAWDDYGEKIRTVGNFLRRAAPRLARTLGVGKPAQQLNDLNATVRQVIGANKTLRTVTERAEDLREAYEAMRDATPALTEGNPELITEAEQEIAADGVDDAERDAYFALVEEADHHYTDAAAIEELEDVYTGEADVVETLGRPAEGGGGTSGGAMCGSNYEEFPVDDKTSTCVWNSLVEWNCYAGSRHMSHPDSGGANACLYYSLDFFQPDGTCRENYAKVTFQGRQACRWAELGADKVAWYTLEKEHGVESPQHGVNASRQLPPTGQRVLRTRHSHH